MVYKNYKVTYAVKCTIISIVAILLLYILFSGSEQRLVSISNETPTQTDDSKEKVTISETIFSASGKNPYTIAAREVTHSNNGIYFLDKVSGSYNVSHNGAVNIKAELGYFDSILNFVELKKDVKISYLGYDIISQGIKLDLQRNSANSPGEVHMHGTGGEIDAESFKTSPEFNQITFHGNVKAHFIINNTKR